MTATARIHTPLLHKGPLLADQALVGADNAGAVRGGGLPQGIHPFLQRPQLTAEPLVEMVMDTLELIQGNVGLGLSPHHILLFAAHRDNPSLPGYTDYFLRIVPRLTSDCNKM